MAVEETPVSPSVKDLIDCRDRDGLCL